MSQSYDLFCRWKHVQKIQSDNAGAIALGVTRAAVSSWKQGKNAEIQYIEKMALDIGDSPESWSALVMAERSNSEDEKAAWTRIARKLGAVAMALVVSVGLASPAPVQASESGHNEHGLYIMRNGVGVPGRAIAAPICRLHSHRTARLTKRIVSWTIPCNPLTPGQIQPIARALFGQACAACVPTLARRHAIQLRLSAHLTTIQRRH
ncbi:DUF3693 domain-containing protein [Stenotrophomonas terrae]|uniref:DUF3693 domain-containing protein n=1 Tax=Stenotrophomonas terrae TaxID=405446 RepID=UPI00071079CC|nr:DUF3693 domain-containing protein [Stenotrophomonas terrae]